MTIQYSVIIPTYNSAKYIVKTLNSVIKQTFTNYEIIISDDGSNDNTVELVHNTMRQHSIKYQVLQNKHSGPGETRNIAVRASNGKWIAFLDSDDIWYPDKLSKISKYISKNTHQNIFTHSILYLYGENSIKVNPSKYIDDNFFLSLYKCNPLATSAIIVKRSLLNISGLFDSSLLSAQDYDLWLRISLLPETKIGFIETVLGENIERQNSVSSNLLMRLNCTLSIGEKYEKAVHHNSRLYFVHIKKYKSKAYTDCGYQYLRNGKYWSALKYILLGFLCWPFRTDIISQLINRLKQNISVT